jgi:hypothetical protein
LLEIYFLELISLLPASYILHIAVLLLLALASAADPRWTWLAGPAQDEELQEPAKPKDCEALESFLLA